MQIDWTFGGSWPYEPHWFDSADGRMHYVDVGPRDGRPVVLLHGNPTWGYLYRNFIGPLTDAGHRVIVPDHLGFGRSDKPDEPELYRISRHADRLDALLESLDLRDATLVPQDWGGPISLRWAVRHPDRIRGLFILNTGAYLPKAKEPLSLPLRLFRTPGVGEVTVKGLDLFKKAVLFRVGVVHRERLTDEVKQAYLAPHQRWSERTAILAFPRQIPSGPDTPLAGYLDELEAGLEREFRAKPVRIIWGMKDIAFSPQVLDNEWLRTFPDAHVTRIDDAGHFLQEDAHERIVPELLDFVSKR